jgi:L-threonylcarbamoyladenylate synthase
MDDSYPSTPLYLLRPGDPLPAGRGALGRIGLEMPAAALYGRLHQLDTEGWDWIALERPPDAPEWAGVVDRLRRTAR